MKIMIKEADFRRQLKGEPDVGYLFFGDEDYMKATAIRMARGTLCPDSAMAFFNDIRLGGADFSSDQLQDAMMSPPVGSERKLITITGLNFNTMKSSDTEDLLGVLAQLAEYPYNMVILSVESDGLDAGVLPKRPSRLLTDLGEYLTPVWFEKNTPAKLAGWVQKHYVHHGVEAAMDVCHHTVAYCGRDMYILANEIDKVSAYVLAHGRNVVTMDDVKTVAIPAMEYDAFAFTNAIMERRYSDALDILQDLKFRRVEPIFILSEVSRVVCDMVTIRSLAEGGMTASEISMTTKMHEYRVGLYLRSAGQIALPRLRRAVEVCCEADSALKSYISNGYGVIEKLISSL